MTTANFDVLAKPLQPDQGLNPNPEIPRRWSTALQGSSEFGLKEQNRIGTGQRSFARPKVGTEPEARLWKICAEAASPRGGAFEWITFLFFGVLALGTVGFCFAELFQLLNSGALDQTVRALLMK